MENAPVLFDWTREALWLALKAGGIVVAACLLAGILSGVLQSVLRVQDPALSAVPRLMAGALVVVGVFAWMGDRFVEYAASLFGGMGYLGR